MITLTRKDTTAAQLYKYCYIIYRVVYNNADTGKNLHTRRETWQFILVHNIVYKLVGIMPVQYIVSPPTHARRATEHRKGAGHTRQAGVYMLLAVLKRQVLLY